MDVDRIPLPDLWPEVKRRAKARDASVRMEDWPSSAGAWRRVVTAAVVLSLFAGSAVAVWIALRSEQGRRPGVTPTPQATPQPDPWRALQPGLHELPPPPASRIGPALTWTGSELVMWGGALNDGARLFDDGFTFKAEAQTWEHLPASPLSPRYFPAAVWTGREVLIWGGWDGGNGFFGDGAALDPETGTWRMLPLAPIDARFPFGSVWTGTEMIIWGTGRPQPGRAVDGAAYNPSTNTWRRITDAPFPLNDGFAVWTDNEMVVMGSWLDDLNHAQSDTAIAAAYDPSTDRWRELPPYAFSPQGDVDGVWSGEALIVVDGDHTVAAYDPESNAWRALPRQPGHVGEGGPTAAFSNGHVVVDSPIGIGVFRVGDESWSELMVEKGPYLWHPVSVGTAIALVGPAYRDEPPPPLFLWKPVTDPDWKDGKADPGSDAPEQGRCVRPDGGYGATITPGSGPAGTTVTVTGPVPTYREDGSYDPPDEGFQIWWDADPSAWTSLLPGAASPGAQTGDPPVLVAEAPRVETCDFSLSFKVPDDFAGIHTLVILQLSGTDESSDWDSATIYDSLRFELTL